MSTEFPIISVCISYSFPALAIPLENSPADESSQEGITLSRGQRQGTYVYTYLLGPMLA